MVQVGQNLTVNNGSCVTISVISTSSTSNCQRIFVTPLTRGAARRSPMVIPQGSAQPRAVLQLRQCCGLVYVSCSQPPSKPQQQAQDQQANGQPLG